ncbi:recombination protein F [Anaerostipes hadrus]|uniref:Recombination protein F n=1 Tax=Anaerostipes hadrus TaxID=649756 RepID=A0A174JGA9_ANAHA|nr:AAA family ATPase [Anaerostipes hadrus]CUO96159.1 recombination protein F [Anaerostipes hadrus]
MAIIENIHIKTFRGLNNLNLEDLAQINILTGKNNSGKTSVLEMLKNFRNFMDWDHQNMLAGNEKILYTNAYLEEFQELFDIDSEEKIITYEVGLKSKKLNVSIKATDENTCHAEIQNLLRVRIPIVSDKDRFLELDQNLKRIFEYHDLYKEAVGVLKEYDDDIIGIEYEQDGQPGPNYGHYTWTITKSSGKHIPLNIYGDGMKKALFLMAMTMKAKNGILLLDNFEVSIHPAAMDKTFRWILRACKKLNIQVFLTSHNKEAIDKILKCDPEITKDVALYTLSRINGKTAARRVLGEKAIEMQDEMGLELR